MLDIAMQNIQDSRRLPIGLVVRRPLLRCGWEACQRHRRHPWMILMKGCVILNRIASLLMQRLLRPSP
jgi:hypothetical protein